MKKIMSIILRNQTGNVVLVVALSMGFLMGATALSVDVGKVYSEKASLQKALDAAVLAGAQVIRNSEAQAITVAKELSQKNSYPLENSQFTTTSDSIKVAEQVTVPMTFLSILGIENIEVTASARAVVAPLQTGRGITPIAVEKDSIPNGTELKCANTGNASGNCGYLALGGSGANELANGILNGSEVSVGSLQSVVTEPGQKWGPVKSAFQELIDRDANKPHCQDPATADNTCSRVIYVMVIDSWDDAQGRDTVPVVGLAAYWVEDILEPKRIVGKFIKTITAGEIGLTGSEFSLYGVKLVE
ncbi:pilus assembly protein TadG-related protein [Litchfieldia salsa]|uniref:Flp pilus assembly protein TadG n=1 Tax=Litchfieldia salsa TaxID=930152 RepID=A0A1H0UC62_9BACI|nr:TadE/TadG family type IV pilus assembly protein [Litchfieldia salsa]SDP63769.1 Flp pilus assembly protein TadG [Litchfieldia salsa]